MLVDHRGKRRPGASTASLAASLYRELAASAENVLFSPYSVACALLMVGAGASGSARREIESLLESPVESLLKSFPGIRARLESYSDVALAVSNGLWCQTSYAHERGFLEDVTGKLEAEIDSVDFESAPSEAVRRINAWVAESTRGTIRDLLSEAQVSSLTRALLANAVYFKASWTHPFDDSETRPETFQLRDGRNVEVPTMHVRAPLRYARTEGVQWLELPYRVGDVRKLLIVPDRDRGGGLSQELDLEEVTRIVDTMQTADVALSLPRYQFRWYSSLSATLARLGVITAFQPEADFSRVSLEPGFALSEVIHSAFIEAAEWGTEAAAVTMAILTGGAVRLPDSPLEVRVDRPFAFLIYDRFTDTVLFAGRVSDPRRS